MKLFELLKKVITHNYCDECGFTEDITYVHEYYSEGGWLLCEKCIEKSKDKKMIKTYKKKPVTIQAVQFTEENKDQVFNWASGLQMNIHPSFEGDMPCLRIPTLEGEMTCSLGDYLIKEPFPTDWRKLYPCKPDIFELTYEEV